MEGPASEAPQTVATEKLINFVMAPIIFTFECCKRHYSPEASKPPATPPSTNSKEETTLLAKQEAIAASKTRSHRRRQTVSHPPARDEEIESEEIESERLIDMRVLVKIIKYLFFVVVGLYAVALLGGPALLFHMMLDKHVDYNNIYDARDWDLPAPDTLTLFTQDSVKIVALESRPDSAKAVVICLSGIENPSVTAFWGHVREFNKRGIAAILPDLRAHGQSSGERIAMGWEEFRDVAAVTDYIEANYPAETPVTILGLSMGAAVAINSIGCNERIDGIVSISGYSSVEDALTDQIQNYIGVLAYPFKPFFSLTAWIKYGVNPWKTRPESAIAKLNGRPALLMHSKEDSQIPFKSFERLTKAAAEAQQQQVQLLTKEGDNHMFCDRYGDPAADSTYFATVMNFIESVQRSR